MKNRLFIAFFSILTLILVSWGRTGHKTVGLIAQNHLTDNAKLAMYDLIGDTSLADISNYADEIRSHSKYKYTGPWHYINLPTGLDSIAFDKAVREETQDNVYNVLKKLEIDLIDPSKSKADRIFALKLIVHFVGDLHQPMHVSRAEDLGGNKINVTFNGKEGNLHGLWDSGLIEYRNLTFEQLANKYDNATPGQIKRWQNQDMSKWLYESYKISSQLYKEAEANSNFGEDYYKSHIHIVAERLVKAGIRLAGVLNDAFNGGPYSIIPPPSVSKLKTNDSTNKPIRRYKKTVTTDPTLVESKNLANYINKTVVTTGTIISTRLIESNNMTLLNVGAAYPNQDFTIMIRGENRSKFGQPEIDLKGKTVVVKGLVIDYKGKPEIELTDTNQLIVKTN